MYWAGGELPYFCTFLKQLINFIVHNIVSLNVNAAFDIAIEDYAELKKVDIGRFCIFRIHINASFYQIGILFLAERNIIINAIGYDWARGECMDTFDGYFQKIKIIFGGKGNKCFFRWLQ